MKTTMSSPPIEERLFCQAHGPEPLLLQGPMGLRPRCARCGRALGPKGLRWGLDPTGSLALTPGERLAWAELEPGKLQALHAIAYSDEIPNGALAGAMRGVVGDLFAVDWLDILGRAEAMPPECLRSAMSKAMKVGKWGPTGDGPAGRWVPGATGPRP